MTIAEYPQKYVDYLHNKKGVYINDGDFALRMNVFGEFNIQNPDQMELLGVLVKVILTRAANAVRMASSIEDLGQEFGEISLSKVKERAPDDTQADTLISGRPSIGGGRASPQSSSRSSSPTPGPVLRGRNLPAADPQVR